MINYGNPNWAGFVVENPGASLPFQAGPQLAPQGFLGGLLGGPVGGLLGQGIGGLLGNAQLGQQIGSLAGGIGGSFLPFQAGPQLAPYGFFGDLLGQVGQPLGSAIGSAFGNQQLGGTIGNVAGQLGRFLPFQAGPQLAPYGVLTGQGLC